VGFRALFMKTIRTIKVIRELTHILKTTRELNYILILIVLVTIPYLTLILTLLTLLNPEKVSYINLYNQRIDTGYQQNSVDLKSILGIKLKPDMYLVKLLVYIWEEFEMENVWYDSSNPMGKAGWIRLLYISIIFFFNVLVCLLALNKEEDYVFILGIWIFFITVKYGYLVYDYTYIALFINGAVPFYKEQYLLNFLLPINIIPDWDIYVVLGPTKDLEDANLVMSKSEVKLIMTEYYFVMLSMIAVTMTLRKEDDLPLTLLAGRYLCITNLCGISLLVILGLGADTNKVIGIFYLFFIATLIVQFGTTFLFTDELYVKSIRVFFFFTLMMIVSFTSPTLNYILLKFLTLL